MDKLTDKIKVDAQVAYRVCRKTLFRQEGTLDSEKSTAVNGPGRPFRGIPATKQFPKHLSYSGIRGFKAVSTPGLSDAGCPARPPWQPRLLARVRSSELVRLV